MTRPSATVMCAGTASSCADTSAAAHTTHRIVKMMTRRGLIGGLDSPTAGDRRLHRKGRAGEASITRGRPTPSRGTGYLLRGAICIDALPLTFYTGRVLKQQPAGGGGIL